MKLVVIGETNHGSRTLQRVRALRTLGHAVEVVSTTPEGWKYETQPTLFQRLRYRLRLPADATAANARLADASLGADVVILDNARAIRPRVLSEIKSRTPSPRLLWYSEDDMMNSIHRSRGIERSIGLFDLWVTTKSFNAKPSEMPSLGARRVLFTDNAFDPLDHAPIQLEPDDCECWGADVSFVGTFERPRARSLAALARAGIRVRVWGNGWKNMAGKLDGLRIENRPVYGDDYRRVVAASAINLCFLRHGNRDLQTCRSVEIPAMGGFMLHEASSEITRLFTPGVEAVYFRTDSELLSECQNWLVNSSGREKIALAGQARAMSAYSHQDCWRRILAAVLEDA